MEIRNKADGMVEKVLGKKHLLEQEVYRITYYAIFKEVLGSYYLVQTLTGMILTLDKEEWDKVRAIWKREVTGEELRQNGLESLVEYHFAVPKESDEYKQYSLIRLVARNLTRKERGIKTYTILPTTGCNARCTYCFEENMPILSMSSDTADQVVKFILQTRRKEGIELRWFGGEPLVRCDIIRQICEALTKAEVPFQSKIVTNASLMTRKLAQEAKNNWHLTIAQVSVDGVRADYEERKRYVNPTLHNYDTMIAAVHAMLDAGIEIDMRCNYDGNNYDTLKTFIDEVSREFCSSDLFHLHFGMLFQYINTEEGIKLYERSRELSAYVAEKGIKQRKVNSEKKFRANYCIADSQRKSVVIAPDGSLNLCEHLPEELSVGSIYDENYLDKKWEDINTHEDCKVCPFLPVCTPFYKTGCPGYFERCKEFREIDMVSRIEGINAKQ